MWDLITCVSMVFMTYQHFTFKTIMNEHARTIAHLVSVNNKREINKENNHLSVVRNLRK